MIKNCLICLKEYRTKPSHEKRRKYCSYKCSASTRIGKPSWNAGKAGSYHLKIPSRKGIRNNTGRTLFRKGDLAWNKDKKIWLGSDGEYRKLHSWIRKEVGKPIQCEHCGAIQQLVWANKSQTYQKDIRDWIALCRSCHMKYDMVFIKKGDYGLYN